MNKKEVAAILDEIAVLLELAGENPFKARSYANAARHIEQLTEDLDTLVRAQRVRDIQGVGEGLAKKIEELVTHGRLAYYEELRAQFPESLFDLFRIPGLGAKRIKALYAELGVQSLGELEYACAENRLVALKGFGAKMQQKVLDGIAFAKRHKDLHLSNEAMAAAQALKSHLAIEPSIQRIEIAGSLRRRKEVIKDIDILVSSTDPVAIIARFVEAPGVANVTGRGETKSSVVLEQGMAADLRVVGDEAFPFALAYFTGSKEHNVAMRQRAKERGLKLNEYGLFRGDERIACQDEAGIFAALDLPFIPPELREDRGEFDGPVPKLVERGDLRGVFHCHTSYSDGSATVIDMAAAARMRGYRYIVIADHSQSAGYAGGLDIEAVRRQHAEIDAINKGLEGFRVVKGIESDIRTDGALDYADEMLASFEFVIASVHSKLSMGEAEATRRVIRAIAHPATAMLGHPTGRLLLAREGYPLDMTAVFEACAAHRVAIEINANPHRLDLDWRLVHQAKERGVTLCIAPDAHAPEGLDDVTYGLNVARKGGLTAEDLLNTMNAEEVLAWHRGR